jgi:hypothetical protein
MACYFWRFWTDPHYTRGTSERLSGEAAKLAAAVFAQHTKKKET